MRSRLALAGEPIGAGEEVEVLGDRQLAVERELLRHVADALARRGARRAQVDAGDAQRAAGRRQQAAEHAEGGRLAGAVGAEQAEDLAGLDLEADVVDGGEGAELAHQIADLDGVVAVVGAPCVRPSESDRGAAAPRSPAVQQHHEAVLEARRDRRRVDAGERAALGLDQPHLAALRHRVDDVGIVEQPRLEQRAPARPPAAWRGTRAPPRRSVTDCGGPCASTLPSCMTTDVLAALRLVQVRGADQHRQALVVDEVQDDLPQLAPRQRVDADRRLVEQQQVGRAHQRAGEAELLLHAARQPAGEALGERPEVGHLHEPRIDRAALRRRSRRGGRRRGRGSPER